MQLFVKITVDPLRPNTPKNQVRHRLNKFRVRIFRFSKQTKKSNQNLTSKNKIKNSSFADKVFFDKDGNGYPNSNDEIIEKFQSITGIQERRYADKEHKTSDLAAFASIEAIKDAGIDKESLDYIIVAHNFGNIESRTKSLISLKICL